MTTELRPSCDERAALRQDGLTRPATAASLLVSFAPYYVLRGSLMAPAGPEEGPQSRFQPALEAGQGLRVRPLPSGQHIADDSVVHSSDLADLPQGGPLGDLAESDGEQADGLGVRVGADSPGPVRGELGGGASLGPHSAIVRKPHSAYRVRHPLYVSAYTPEVPGPHHLDASSHTRNRAPRARVEAVVSPRSAGKQPRQLTEEEHQTLAAYSPKVIPAHRWALVRDYTLTAVAHAGAYSAGHVRKDLHKVARYIDWAHNTMGRALEHEDVFDHDLIAYYAIHALADYTQASRATTRSTLFWFADHLVPPTSRVMTIQRMGRAQVSRPYSEAEITRMMRWATEQPTPYKRHACWTTLVFGLGAGLRTRELDQLRREDVVADEHGVLVHVRGGSNPRIVPMLADWEQHALVVAECVAPGAFIFKPERDGSRVKDIGFTLGHSVAKPDFAVNMQRMRTTWQVRLLNAGVPVQVLAAAAGLTGVTGIERLFEFLDPVPEAEAREAICAEGLARFRARVEADREGYNARQRLYQRRARALARQFDGAHDGR